MFVTYITILYSGPPKHSGHAEGAKCNASMVQFKYYLLINWDYLLIDNYRKN